MSRLIHSPLRKISNQFSLHCLFPRQGIKCSSLNPEFRCISPNHIGRKKSSPEPNIYQHHIADKSSPHQNLTSFRQHRSNSWRNQSKRHTFLFLKRRVTIKRPIYICNESSSHSPGVQSVQLVPTPVTLLAFPTSQRRHSVLATLPVEGRYLPARQEVQEICSLCGLYFPISQSSHVVALEGTFVTAPTVQMTQSADEMAASPKVE